MGRKYRCRAKRPDRREPEEVQNPVGDPDTGRTEMNDTGNTESKRKCERVKWNRII